MSLADEIQQRFDASVIEPSPNAIEKADKTLAAAARLFYGAVVERLSFLPANPGYFSEAEPGAALYARLHRFERMGRLVLAELGSQVATSPEGDEHEDAAGSAASSNPWSDDAPAPGALVRDSRLLIGWRVIRSRNFDPDKTDALLAGYDSAAFAARFVGWKCLCERLSGDEAGEQEWIPACELVPYVPSEAP